MTPLPLTWLPSLNSTLTSTVILLLPSRYQPPRGGCRRWQQFPMARVRLRGATDAPEAAHERCGRQLVGAQTARDKKLLDSQMATVVWIVMVMVMVRVMIMMIAMVIVMVMVMAMAVATVIVMLTIIMVMMMAMVMVTVMLMVMLVMIVMATAMVMAIVTVTVMVIAMAMVMMA